MSKRITLFFITAIYIGINIWWLKTDARLVSVDPPWHFISSLKIWYLLSHFSLDEMRYFVLCSVQPPLVGILVRPFLLFFGTNLDGAVLTMDLIFLPVLIFSTSKIIQFYTNKAWQGILGSLMLLACPGVIFLSRFYLLDIPLMAMTTLSFYLLISTREFMERKYTIACAVAMGLGNLTKLSFVFYIAAPLLFLLPKIDSREKTANFIIFSKIFLAITAAWYLPNYKTILLLLNTKFVEFKDYGFWLAPYFITGVILCLFFIFFMKKIHVNTRIKRFSVIIGICMLLSLFYIPRQELLRSHAWGFLDNLGVFINGGIGIINFLILCLCVFLIGIRWNCPVLILAWLLIPMAIFFQWARSELRYILPCLPAMVVFILIALENLHKKLRNSIYSIIMLNSIFLIVTYTWPLNFLPRDFILTQRPKIFLSTSDFWVNAHTPLYGSVYPQGQSDYFYLDEFFDAVRNSGIRDGEVIWLLSGDHHVFGNSTVSYYSAIRKMNVKFYSLYPNAFEHDAAARISNMEFRYFVDVEGFGREGIVEAARSFIKANQDKFQIIFERDIPGDNTVVVYKKI